MKYFLSAALLCSALFANAQDQFGSVFAKINTEVQQNSKAYQTLKYETENIGHRLTGSANGAKAEQYAYNLL
ncbi:MAG: aminopeptidase, partial [Pedobacter sp.]